MLKFIKSRFDACNTKESLFLRMYQFLTFDMGSEGSRCHCCIFWRGMFFSLALWILPVCVFVDLGWLAALAITILEAGVLISFMKVTEV